ncbi:hypothetical protein GGF46_001923 [Coemansia sp. RSA 552]|nr:hypothetical protein GGF46_001923 [Coemansia sp. RSA 552]
MSGNVINSRLQRFQSRPGSRDSESAYLPPSPASSTDGVSAAPRREIPACKGRAADLINKFNQLSASGSSNSPGWRSATVGRPSPAVMREGVQQLFATPSPTESTPTASPTKEHGTGHRRAVGSAEPQPRRSLFLTDTELDRALSEIREFGRNMNITLEDL